MAQTSHSSSFDLVAALSILGAGVVAAVVCFGFLSSDAAGKLSTGYSLTGAIAGALAAAGFTGQLYKALRKSSANLQDLRRQFDEQNEELRRANKELEQKLIRGAPRPNGFVTEVDERQRLVLSRPARWEPVGANVFAFECPAELLDEGDTFPPSLRVSYEPISPATPPRDAYYRDLQARFERGLGVYGGPYRSEVVALGGDPGAIASLKLLARTYVRNLARENPLTGQVETSRVNVSLDEFESHVRARINAIVVEHAPQQGRGWMELKQRQDIVELIRRDAERELENGRLPYARLAEFVHARLGTDAPETGTGPGEGVAPLPSPRPSGSAASQGAESASSVRTAERPAVETDEILPVAEMWICCYHDKLGKIFFFMFADNSTDYLESSANFNAIMQSVRFLT